MSAQASTTQASLHLKPGKERSLLRRHPWVFEGSIAKGRADPGETVRVEAADGRFLAWGAYSPTSSIRVRAWSFDEAERIDAAFFARRIARAVALRRRLPVASDGVRLVHGEADGLPGLIVDRYGGPDGEHTLCAQFLAVGSERWKATIADALLAATGCTRLYERSDASVRGQEGLPEVAGWLKGEGATEVAIREHDWTLTLDVASAASVSGLAWQIDGEAFDVVVINAGVFGPRAAALDAPTQDDFDTVMRTNVLGPMRLLPQVAEALAPGARLAIISSRMGSIGLRTNGSGWLYRASKAAVNSVMKDASLALAGKATVISFHPGWVKTDMGGAGADIDAHTSIAGMRTVLASVKPADSGAFFNYDGQRLDW